MAWLTGWTYRKEITVTNASADYQTKVLVGESSGASGEEVDCGGLCQTDFDDLRFTAADGTTLLDYWIESIIGTTPNQLATIWVQNNATPDTTLYMYYGNAGANAVSNGANTFEDFSAGDDLTTGWTETARDWVQGNGEITMDDAGAGVAAILTRTGKTITDGAIRMRAQQRSNEADNAPGGGIFFRGNGSTTGYQATQCNKSTTNQLQNNSIGDWAAIGTFVNKTIDLNVYYILDVHMVGNSVGSTHDATVYANGNTDGTHTSGGYGVRIYESDWTIDWFLVRKYAATEPSFAWGSEETWYTKSISDTVIIADSPTKVVDFQRSISDAIIIADSPSKAIAIPRADTITIADLAEYLKALYLFLSDTVAITDSFSKVSEFNPSLSDTVAIADLLAKVSEFNPALADTVTIADVISKAQSLTFADTITITDGYGRLIGSADVSVYSDVETDYFHLSKFTAEFTGNVNQFRIRSLGTHNVKVALYDDNAGEPGNLMNAVNTPQLVVSDWNRIPFPSTAIVKGTDYWLAFNSE